MYVYISETCQQEAKTYNIETKIEELAGWVKNGDFQDFKGLFEIFEHPYYVRKGVYYRYRLLAKLVDIPYQGTNYQIAVFFRLFHRGSDDYETLFHQASKHGDFFYYQQDIDDKLEKFLEETLLVSVSSVHNFIPYSEPNSFAYFMYAKTNLLQFGQPKVNQDYYHEKPSWYYGTRPFLTQLDLQYVFEWLQQGLDSGKTQYCMIGDNRLHFLPYPPTLSQDGDTTVSPFTRYLPEEIVLDYDKWQQCQLPMLPLFLNVFQQKICDKIFLQNDCFPLLVNAPAQQGKTRLLALLATHYLMQPPISSDNNDNDNNVLPVLLLCSSHEVDLIKQEIHQYLVYQLDNNSNIKIPKSKLLSWIDECCMDSKTLINTLCPKIRQQFDGELLIERGKFETLWKKAPCVKNHQLKHLPIDLVWFVLQHLIKGKMGLFGNNKPFGDTLPACDVLSSDLYQTIYQQVWLDWYQPLANEGYWDYQDLWQMASAQGGFSKHFLAVLVDNTEEYSAIMLQTLIQMSVWWQQPKLLNQAPLIFVGNIYANTVHKIFHWQNELNTLLHEIVYKHSDSTLFAPQTIDYVADFISNLHYAIQLQRNKTNLICFDNAVNNATKLLDMDVYFVDVTQTDVTHAVLLSDNITLIANTYSKHSQMYLKKSPTLGQWFDYADSSQICLTCYTLKNLPQKHRSYSVALLDFADADFGQFGDPGADFAFLSFEKRFALNAKLSAIQLAIGQGLQRLFILGRPEERILWEALFLPVLAGQPIVEATLEGIDPHYMTDTQKLKDDTATALDSQDTEQIFAVALRHYYRFDYLNYLKLLLRICEITQDYGDYFDLIVTDKQQEFTFEFLWQQQKADVFLQYAQVVPKCFKANLIALQLLNNQPIKINFEQAFSIVTDKYLKQRKLDVYAEFWAIIFPQLLEKLTENPDVEHWKIIGKQLEKLIKAGIEIPPSVKAFVCYKKGDLVQAKYYWQLTEELGCDKKMPEIYYELCLAQATTWQDKLIYLTQLNRLGELMNVMIKQDLSELQLSYWDKILPYLTEQDKLESVLLVLLPKVHQPEILERIYQYCQRDDKTSEGFLMRLQRLRTLQACLDGDWGYVIERLEHYRPIEDFEDAISRLSQNFQVTKTLKGSNQKNIKIATIPKMPPPQTEIIDILYGLNLNNDLMIVDSRKEFEIYRQNDDIQQIFSLLRKLLSKSSGNKNDCYGRCWNITFPAVRSLTFLLEKSDKLKDGLEVYDYIANYSDNKKHKIMAIERLYVLLDRAKRFVAEGYKETPAVALDDDASTKNVENNTKGSNVCCDLSATITAIEKNFAVLLKKISPDNIVLELPVLKTSEEMINSILSLTNKEHREIQRLEAEQRQAQKRQQAEIKQLEKQAEQQEKERQKLERSLEKKAEQQRLEAQKQEIQKQEQENSEHDHSLQNIKSTPSNPTVIKENMEEKDTLLTDKVPNTADMVNDATSQLSSTVSSSTSLSSTVANMPKPLAPKATVALMFFDWRVFISRLHQRLNVEDVSTGERCSFYFESNVMQSDWEFTLTDDVYRFVHLPLIIQMVDQEICLCHYEQGVTMMIDVS